jgi:hypothetical protein
MIMNINDVGPRGSRVIFPDVSRERVRGETETRAKERTPRSEDAKEPKRAR